MIQQEMLEYQKLDGELNRIERDLKKNEFYLKRKQYKAMSQECDDNRVKLDQKASDLRIQLQTAQQSMQKISDIIDEHTKEFASIEDEEEINYMSKKLAEQLDALNSIEKEIKRILHDGEEIAKLFDDINAKLPKLVSAYKKCDDEFNKATEEIKPRVAEIKLKQSELRKIIDNDLFEKYKKIAETIHPVFVPLKDECRCGGCQMEMPKAVVDAQMKDKDYMRCEHCGRIIYKS